MLRQVDGQDTAERAQNPDGLRGDAEQGAGVRPVQENLDVNPILRRPLGQVNRHCVAVRDVQPRGGGPWARSARRMRPRKRAGMPSQDQAIQPAEAAGNVPIHLTEHHGERRYRRHTRTDIGAKAVDDGGEGSAQGGGGD